MPFTQLVLVLYLVLAFFTPVLAIFLFVREAKLRKQLKALEEENTRQHSTLQRDIAEVKRQLAAATQHPAPAAQKPPATELRQTEPVPRTFPPVEVPPPLLVSPAKVLTSAGPRIETPEPAGPPVPSVTPPLEKKPEILPEQKPQPPAPILPPATAVPASVLDPKPPAPARPAEPRPLVPAAAPPPPLEKKPPVSAVAPPVAPPVPPAPPKAPSAIPPAAAARVSTPPPFSALRVPAPKPTLQQRMKGVDALEEALGTNWLLKLGIILVVIGVAFFGIYELGALGALGKVAISYVTSIVLLVGGIFLEKRETYRLLGRTAIGGGWALLFFSTFGIYHVGAMHVLNSLTLDCALMLIVAVAMAAHTLRYRSQFVTGLAFLLAYTTVALSHDTVYSLSSGVILAIGLVAIVLKMGWFELEVFGILASYLNHLYWLYRILGVEGAQGRPFEAYHASLAMLFFYWLTFRVSYVFRAIKTDFEEHVSTLSALLNTLLLLGIMKFQSVQPELAYLALLVVGAFEFSFAQLPVTRRRRRAFVVLSIMGAVLMLAAAPFHYSGNNVAILWLVGAEVFLAAGIIFKEVVFRGLGLLTGLLVGLHIIGIDFRQLVTLRASGEGLALASGVLFALCAAAFYLNALGIGSRWKDFFADTPDRQFLTIHTYIGAFAAGAAVWALFSRDWTALAFAAVMLVLAAFGRKLESFHLQVQYALFGALTMYRALAVNLHLESPQHTHVNTRILTLPLLAAMFYITAKLAAFRDDPKHRIFRGLFAFAGTSLFALLIWFEVPELWQPVAFIAFAVALSEAGAALRYHALAAHAHLLTLLAVFTALTADSANLHVWHAIPVHALAALPVIAGCYWLAKRLGVENPRHLEIARSAYTWVAAGLMLWVLYEALHTPWIAVGWIALALLLALSTRWIPYRQLVWQANTVSACAFLRAYLFNLGLQQMFWHQISLRLFTVGLVTAGAYLLAKIAAGTIEQFKPLIRNAYTWVAAFFVGILIWYEAPHAWMAVFFLVAGILLALVGRRWKLPHLGFQEHLFAIAAVARAFDVNYELTASYGRFSLRLITISFIAAGLYAVSRLATERDARHALVSAYLHTTAATTLLALLMWKESSTAWLAALWALFAFALAALDRRFKLDDLRWQAHALAAITLMRSVVINLHVEETWHGVSVRLLSLSIVALVFYALSRLIRMPDHWRARDFHHIYSWSASTVVSLLLWYELQSHPPSIAVGWAVFGLVLFEYGLLRKISQFRYQAYVALIAAFTRIFFSNLTASEAGEFWGPRLYTILPIVLIFFFMYAQLPAKEADTARDRRWHFDALLAYLGTATIAALFYFQFASEWVVTSYAALAFALFVAAWAMDRPIFLDQGILLAAATFARGLAHNLFGAGYFGEGDWTGRYFVVGSAVAILLASLIFGFRLRGRYAASSSGTRWSRALSVIRSRPEQLQFFLAIILLTTMLDLKMREGMITVAWGIEGVFIILLAFAVKERSFRLSGLGLLLLCVGRVLAMDVWRLQPRDRYVTFIIVGSALVLVSVLYTRHRETIRQFL